MKKFNLIDDLGFVTTGVEEYQGEKNYYSTGSIKEFVNNAEGKFSYKNRPSRANRCVQKGDVLQAKMQNTQKAILIDDNYSGSLFSTGFFQLRPPRNLVDSKYIYYCLQTKWFQNLKDSLCSGATQKSINDKKLKEINFFLPPLTEQKRIVAKLDKAIAEIDKAFETVRKRKIFIEKFESLSILQSISKNSKILKSKKLGEICKLVGGGTPSKSESLKEKYYGGDILWASVRDMKNELLSDTELKITDEGLKNSSSNIIPAGNVIIASRVGLGKVCLIEKDTAINQDLRGIIPLQNDEIDINFLFFWFKSIAPKIVSAGRGATVHGVKLTFLQSLEVPLPPINHQKFIVSKLKNISERLKQIQNRYTNLNNEYSLLKSAILKKELQSEAL